MGLRIIKCSCHGVTFSRLKNISEKHGASSISELKRYAQFAENCKRCVPYVLQMLESGRTEFHELLESKTENLGGNLPDNSFGDEGEL